MPYEPPAWNEPGSDEHFAFHAERYLGPKFAIVPFEDYFLIGTLPGLRLEHKVHRDDLGDFLAKLQRLGVEKVLAAKADADARLREAESALAPCFPDFDL